MEVSYLRRGLGRESNSFMPSRPPPLHADLRDRGIDMRKPVLKTLSSRADRKVTGLGVMAFAKDARPT